MKQRNFLFRLLIISLLFQTFTIKAQQWGLYTLVAPVNSNIVTLVDTNGTTYKTWTFGTSYKTGFSTYLIPGDTLIRPIAHVGNSLNGGGMTGEVQKSTWDGTVVWDFVYSTTTYSLHHDVCPMPNGNILMTCYEVKTAADATAAGSSSAITIWAEKLIEVKPTGPTTGDIVWEWHIWDHLSQSYNSAKNNYVTSISQHPELFNINYITAKDWIHMNGIDYNKELDQITFSSRTMNEIYVIDHSTTTAEAATHSGGNSGKGGDLLYRWGNPAAYGLTGTTNFNVVHDAHWISKNNPKYPNFLCGFNNGGGTGSKSAIDIINPPYNGFNYTVVPGQVALPSAYTYRYNCSAASQSNGSSQQLPNGNILICISTAGSIFEIDSLGTIVWSMTSSGAPASALRYEKCDVRGPIATASASSTTVNQGSPIILSATAISPSETSPTYKYEWSTGDTTQNPTVYPSSTTTYIVKITNTAVGCSDTASVKINVVAGITENNEDENLQIYPNPTNGILNINGIFNPNNNVEIAVINNLGKIVLQKKNTKTIDMSDFSNGIYCISIKINNSKIINKKIVLSK